MNAVLEMVEENRVVLITKDETELDASVLGTRQLNPNMLIGAGFNLFVKPEFALKFKYVASIYNLAQELYSVEMTRHLVVDAIEDTKSRWNHKFTNGGSVSPLLFKGKLPLWVINRTRLAVGMGVRDITIHSNDKMLEKDIIRTDPIIMGWVGFSPLFDWLIKNKGEMPRWYYSAPTIQPKNPFGFVIAIFGDSEII